MSPSCHIRPVLDPPQAGIWDYVSPSRLNLWLQCPLAFKLRYIDGVRLPTTAGQFIGKQVHAGLELWYRHRQYGVPIAPTEVIERMDATWERHSEVEQVVFESVPAELEARRQVVALLNGYFSVVPKDEPVPVAVEARVTARLVDPLTGQDLGVPLLGIIDLVLQEQAGLLVVDFKTSSRSATDIEFQHEVQLSSYSYLLRKTMRQTESGLEIRSLIKTRTPKVEPHRFEPRQDRHFRRLFAVLREYFDALDKGRFTYRPSWSCQTCALRESYCRQWDG